MARLFRLIAFLNIALLVFPSPGQSSRWRTFGAWWEEGAQYQTDCATEFQGQVYIGGWFYNVAGQPMRKIARWDGAMWHRLGLGVDDWPCPELICDSRVQAMVADSTFLYVGGYFPSVNGGITAPYVALWDGTYWAPMGAGFNAQVHDMVIYRGDVIAAGSFTSTGGTPVGRIARWDGASWQPLGTGANAVIVDPTVPSLRARLSTCTAKVPALVTACAPTVSVPSTAA
jgi:hypothetical protein